MRKMILASFLMACLGCGDDSGTPVVDSPGGGGDSAGGGDGGGGGGDGGGGADATSGGGGEGSLCVTSAVPPNPGSCGSGLVCCAGETTICVEGVDCPGGNMYVVCTAGGNECESVGGRICCQTPEMTFCTKPSTCDDLGGTEI